MAKIRLNYIQLLFLITAFLSTQWATSHIHFTEQHSHDGNFHKHQVKTHSHQYLATDNTIIQKNHSNIIELDYEYNKQNSKKTKIEFTDIGIVFSNTSPPFSFSKLKIDSFLISKKDYFTYSSSNPRAPPLNS